MNKVTIFSAFFAGFLLGAISVKLLPSTTESIAINDFVKLNEEISLDGYSILQSPSSSELMMIAKCATDGANDQKFVKLHGLIDPRDVTLYKKNGSDDYVVSFRMWQTLDLYVAYFISSAGNNPEYKGIYSLA